jgi:hypothetical protein
MGRAEGGLVLEWGGVVLREPTVRHPSESWDLGRLSAAVSGAKLDPG